MQLRARCHHRGVALAIDMSRPARTPSDRYALVDAVLQASTHEQETSWVEWKRELDIAGNTRDRFAVAKAIIGFGNRHPDRARQMVGGCGYLLVGVEPQSLVGVQPHDSAAMENWVSPYVGARGPQWNPEYVEHSGKQVLVITVEAPCWGDRIHRLEKGHDNFEAGAIFIRRHGLTERPNSQELDAGGAS